MQTGKIALSVLKPLLGLLRHGVYAGCPQQPLFRMPPGRAGEPLSHHGHEGGRKETGNIHKVLKEKDHSSEVAGKYGRFSARCHAGPDCTSPAELPTGTSHVDRAKR